MACKSSVLGAFVILFLTTSRVVLGASNAPACASSCTQSAAHSANCSTTDTNCLCLSSTFAAGVIACLSSACDDSDVGAAQQSIESLCPSGLATSISISRSQVTADVANPSASSSFSSSPITSNIASSAPTASAMMDMGNGSRGGGGDDGGHKHRHGGHGNSGNNSTSSSDDHSFSGFSSHTKSNNPSDAAAIGGAIGGGIAALLLVAGVFWYFIRRSRRKLRREREKLMRERFTEPYGLGGGGAAQTAPVPFLLASPGGKYITDRFDEEKGGMIEDGSSEQKLERTAAWVATAPIGGEREQASPATESSAVLPGYGQPRTPRSPERPDRTPSVSQFPVVPPLPTSRVSQRPAGLPARPLPTVKTLLDKSRSIRVRPTSTSFRRGELEAPRSVPPVPAIPSKAGPVIQNSEAGQGSSRAYSTILRAVTTLRERVDMLDTTQTTRHDPDFDLPLPNPFEDPPSYAHTPVRNESGHAHPEPGPVQSISSVYSQ